MFDLPYILTHPLLAAIYKRHAELVEKVRSLPPGSSETKELKIRISRIEEYRLPKSDLRDSQLSRPIVNDNGDVIGEVHSIRHRFRERRRGHPAEYRLQTRAALEDKLANPELTWPQLAEKYKFKNVAVLTRAVRRLKLLLRQEGIPLPKQIAYRKAQEAFNQALKRTEQFVSSPPFA